MPLGRHILVELYGSPASVLNDVIRIEACMVRAARAANATVINTSFHRFSPYGVSGVVVIHESHLSIHTWPEYGFAAVDLFTCGDTIDPWPAYEALKSDLKAAHGTTREVDRGPFDGPVQADAAPAQAAAEAPEAHIRNLWFTRREEGIALSLRHAGALFRRQTPHQKIEVLDSYGYGRTLVIDGAIVCTERDEHIYHEMIVHVPMQTRPEAKRALVIGGGDGGALRELLRYKRIEEVVVVELDAMVVSACRQHFPALAPAFEDPRLSLHIADGFDFLQSCPAGSFDLAIVDAANPSGETRRLFSEPFYGRVRKCLRSGGVMVAQTEPPALDSRTFSEIYRRQQSVFGQGNVHCYLACIPTYTTGLLSFSYAATGRADPPDAVNTASARRFADVHGLQYYNDEIHRAAFVLPPYVKRLLRGENPKLARSEPPQIRR
ncbi:MAG: polyamine aminopropyltransferase [Gemmatimonadota bacterium]|nr:polyamine aminopropyltransferase [Gemmatimonadota bacterium]